MTLDHLCIVLLLKLYLRFISLCYHYDIFGPYTNVMFTYDGCGDIISLHKGLRFLFDTCILTYNFMFLFGSLTLMLKNKMSQKRIDC